MSQKLLVTVDDDISDWLDTQPNKSDVVRKALASYRQEDAVMERLDHLQQYLDMRLDALEQKSAAGLASPVVKAGTIDALSELNLGMACCTAKKPCRHWQFDDVNAVWVNQLTNETREV